MGRPRKYARVAEGTPKPREMRAIASDLPARAWRRYPIKEGAKGTIEAEFALVAREALDEARQARCGGVGGLSPRHG
jgi:hypothetical protein